MDSRSCDDRACLNASVGVCAMYEDDNDAQHKSFGLALRNPNDRLNRSGYGAWFRAQWNGWSLEAEFDERSIDYTRKADGSKETAPDQNDYGVEATLHYRFAESNWGVGAKAGIIWLDKHYRTVTIGTDSVRLADTISEFGFVVNYFFWDNNNKLTADLTWVEDNSGVSTTSAGYMVGASRGVVVEDGLMFRIQWQLNF